MPIYEYICDDCGQRYERIVLSQTQDVACPSCLSGRHTLQLSVFNAHGGSGNGAAASRASASFGAPSRREGGSCACGAGGCGRN